MISNEDKQKIAEELKERNTKMICPMCGNKHFVMAEGYFANAIQDNVASFSLGGKNIPTIPIICSNCGFISQHALGVLGLLSNEQNQKPNE